MDKLYKTLSRYLPHNVKVWSNFCRQVSRNETKTIRQIGELSGLSHYRSHYSITVNLEDMALGYAKPLPILRPLSHLNREIEWNGKKIIPIIELAKVAVVNVGNGGILDYKYSIYEADKCVYVTCDPVNEEDFVGFIFTIFQGVEDGIESSSCDPYQWNISVTDQASDFDRYLNNPQLIFDMLYSMHFAVNLSPEEFWELE